MVVAAPTRTPRSSWVEEGLRALGVGGPDAVRIESLAQALGVTKGGFYWHFDDRRALLEEMLDTWERVVSDDVIVRVEALGGDARTKLRHLFALAASIDDLLAIELAIREWARRDPAVMVRLYRLDNRRMDYLRSLFGELSSDPDDVEARCYLVFSLFIANDYIAANHGGSSRKDVIGRATKWLLT
jgi:AcrR family transcriptional regulator